jgi:hypothetical protein
VDYVFIKFADNISTYQFLIHKSSIEDIYPNTIMESRNVTLFKDVLY